MVPRTPHPRTYSYVHAALPARAICRHLPRLADLGDQPRSAACLGSFQGYRLCEQLFHGWMGGITLANMVDANAKDESHMRVVEAVEDLLTNAPARDQTQRTQDP